MEENAGNSSPDHVLHLKERLNTVVNMVNTQTFLCEMEMVRLSQLDPLALSEETLPETNRQTVRSTLNEFAANMHNIALKCETTSVIASYLLRENSTTAESVSSSEKGRTVDTSFAQKAFEASIEACGRSGNADFLSFYMGLVTANTPSSTSIAELVLPEEKRMRVPIMPKKAWRQRYEEEMRLAAEKAGEEAAVPSEESGQNKATGATSAEDLDVLMNQETVNKEEIIDLDQSIHIKNPDDEGHAKTADVAFEHSVVEGATDRHFAEGDLVSPRNVLNILSRPPSSNMTHEDLEVAKDLLSFAGVEIPSEKEATEALDKGGLEPSIFVKREVITPEPSEIHVHVVSPSEQVSSHRKVASKAVSIQTVSSACAVTAWPPTQTNITPEPHIHQSTGTVGDIPLPPSVHDPYIVRYPDSDDQQVQRKKKTKPAETIQAVELFSDEEGSTHERVVSRCRTPPGPPADEYPSQQRMGAASRMSYVYPTHSQMPCVPAPVAHPYPSYHTWNAHCYPGSPASYVAHGMIPTSSASYYAHSSGFQPQSEYDPYAPGTSYDSQQQVLRNEYKRRPRANGSNEERQERKKNRFHD